MANAVNMKGIETRLATCESGDLSHLRRGMVSSATIANTPYASLFHSKAEGHILSFEDTTTPSGMPSPSVR